MRTLLLCRFISFGSQSSHSGICNSPPTCCPKDTKSVISSKAECGKNLNEASLTCSLCILSTLLLLLFLHFLSGLLHLLQCILLVLLQLLLTKLHCNPPPPPLHLSASPLLPAAVWQQIVPLQTRASLLPAIAFTVCCPSSFSLPLLSLPHCHTLTPAECWQQCDTLDNRALLSCSLLDRQNGCFP